MSLKFRFALQVVSAVVGCFVVCWTTFMICLFFKLELQSYVDYSLYSLRYILVTLNFLMNPLIYT
jgi:NADH:ubiquinone oxidoreductase subunit 2 (subunit N)